MLENYKNPELAKMCDIIINDDTFYLGELTSDSVSSNNNSIISNNSSNSNNSTNSNNSSNNNIEKVKIIKSIPLKQIIMKPSNKFPSVLDIYEKKIAKIQIIIYILMEIVMKIFLKFLIK